MTHPEFHRISERIVHERRVLSTLLLSPYAYKSLPEDFSPEWFEDYVHREVYTKFNLLFISRNERGNFILLVEAFPDLKPIVAELLTNNAEYFMEEELQSETEKLRAHGLLPVEQEEDDPTAHPASLRVIPEVQSVSPSIIGESAMMESPPLTDTGNAERFVRRYRGLVCYNHTEGKWYVWNEKHWERDDVGGVMERAKAIAREIYLEAASTPDVRSRTGRGNWAIHSESRAGIENMLRLAQTTEGIAKTSNGFDTDPYLLNLRNGTYDLKAQELLPHSPGHYITKIVDVAFDPTARAPNFQKFARRIFNNDRDLMRFVQRCIGYSLTGDVSEQCIFFLHGTGKNGKTVFMEIFKMTMGDFWQKAPAEMLMLRKSESIPNDVARLRGARFVVASEIQAGRWLNEAKLKDLTGGDTIVARFLYQEHFEFTPTHKLWIYGNHKPNIRGTDEGIWRRIMLIPFVVTIPESERIPMSELMEVMRDELPGILNFALEGYKDYQENGLRPPDLVTAATKTYRAEMDIVGEFFDEQVVAVDSNTLNGKELYSCYCRWAEDRGEQSLKAREFNERIAARGISHHKGHANARIWEGIGLVKSDGYDGYNGYDKLVNP